MKKNILFLHPNFPAQFKHIASHFANKGHDVVFICQSHYNNKIKNIKLFRLKGIYGEEELNSQNPKAIERAMKMGEQYLGGFRELDKQKWHPDIIISHSGWGCGAYAKRTLAKSTCY